MYDTLANLLPPSIQIFFPFFAFSFALFLLVKSADFFIDSAEILGVKLGIPHFIIGVTVIGIGTSLPELSTSLVSIFKSTPENDLTEIVSANIIGSNIANILLGVGIASIIRVVKVDRNLQDNDLPFLFGSTAIVVYFMYDGVLSFWEGILLCCMFLVFLSFSAFGGGQPSGMDKDLLHSAKQRPFWKIGSILILSGIGIIYASDITIRSLTDISPLIGIQKDVASMVLLAVGTSFPEIFVSIVAVQKGKVSLALGNILGSNISNILGILGISALFANISVSEKSIFVGIPFMVIATLFFIFSAMDNRFRIWEGLMTIAIFMAFLGSLFGVF